MNIPMMKDSICLSVVHSVTRKKVVYKKLSGGDEYPEETEVIIKEIPVKKWFKKDGITSVEEYITSKNTIAKNRSVVFDKFTSRFYATFHSPDQVLNCIYPANPIGYDTTIYSSRPQIHKY